MSAKGNARQMAAAVLEGESAKDFLMRTKEEWVMFTKRTNEPKLSWLMAELTRRGIRNRLKGESWHAPILEVPKQQLEAAWKCLPFPVDEIPDDHRIWEDPDVPFDLVLRTGQRLLKRQRR